MTVVDKQTAEKIKNAVARLVDHDVITSHRAEIILAQMEGHEPPKFSGKSFSADMIAQLCNDLDLLVLQGFATPEWVNVRKAVKLGLRLQQPATYTTQVTAVEQPKKKQK